MRPYRLAIDAFVVVWVISMLALGVFAMREFDRLADTAGSFAEIGQQESELAAALAPLESLPLTGTRIATTDAQLREAAASTTGSAAVMRSSLHDLGRIAFGIVALVALFPVVALYMPMRFAPLAMTRSRTRQRHVAA
jgi:hypothetical protein